MLSIRLARFGRKHEPYFRIAVMERKKSPSSNVIEYIGNYSPLSKELNLDKDKAKHWISVGAQPSDTVKRLLVKEKILKAPKHKKVYSKKPGKKAAERAAASE